MGSVGWGGGRKWRMRRGGGGGVEWGGEEKVRGRGGEVKRKEEKGVSVG